MLKPSSAELGGSGVDVCFQLMRPLKKLNSHI